MDRRTFLLMSLVSGSGLTLGRGFLAPAFAAPAQPGDSPYGPLLEPDALGLRLPEGFSSRVIKQYLLPIENTTVPGNLFPDGAATFPTDDGGWILVSNSENPPPVDVPDLLMEFLEIEENLGGVQAIRFAADGTIAAAYDILSGSRSNCAGGATPWGTWLSSEEHDDPVNAANSGRVYECDPTGQNEAVHLPALGHFKHENATVDPVREQLYLSEDLGDGLFYRFTPTSYPDLDAGVLEAALVAEDGTVTWLEIPDPPCAGGTPCRRQADATRFDGGEGCAYDDGKVFLDTKGDDRIWVYDTETETMSVLYDGGEFADPVLSGVDHLIVQPGTGNLLVAEDGGNMEVVMISREDFTVFPIVRLEGEQHGFFLPGPLSAIPVTSEVSGLAFNPAGDRLYFNSQRGFGGGITYEVAGPWLEALQPAPSPTSSTTTSTQRSAPATSTPPATVGGDTLAATGGGGFSPVALGAAASAAGLLALRRRLDRRTS